MEDLISVIIPIYNVQDYLGICLDSVIQNSYKNLEIICVNDGSTDNCAEILEKYSTADNRIKIISKKNGGVSSARNAGLRAAHGDWIAFIDPDDWIDLNYFEILLSFSENADIVACNFQFEYEPFSGFSVTSPLRVGIIEYSGKSALGAGIIINPCTVRIFKKQVVMNCVFDEKCPRAQDKVFNIDVIAQNPDLRICYIPERLYHYFQRNSFAVHSIGSEKVIMCCQALAEHGDNRKDAGIYYYMASKNYLSLRYEFSLYADKRLYRQCNKELLRLMPKLICSDWNFGDKAKVFFAFLFPKVYRKHRINNDTNMLKWEKSVKEAHR